MYFNFKLGEYLGQRVGYMSKTVPLKVSDKKEMEMAGPRAVDPGRVLNKSPRSLNFLAKFSGVNVCNKVPAYRFR